MILRDPVHGLIAFRGRAERVVTALLATAEVQRLRRIRALGLASLAFPGGEHSRFAHAVGSAHVMQRYLERVRELGATGSAGAEDPIDDATADIAVAAALLHDLGHGPLSHTFETLPGARRHETWTEAIISDPTTQVNAALRELDPAAPEAVAALVRGRSPIPHLSRAVSGTFDVDRCDYLMRDSHMTGVRYGQLDLDWLLQSLRLHRAGPGAPPMLAVDGERGLTAVESFFLARLYMYRQVYLHKAVRSAEVLVNALFRRVMDLAAEGRVPAGTPPAIATVLRGETPSIAEYVALDDAELWSAWARYAEGDDVELAGLARAIRERRLPKSLRLRTDVDDEVARDRLATLVRAHGLDPRYHGAIDRVTIDAYTEDHALLVVDHRGGVRPLLEASPVLHGLAAERFEMVRAVVPAALRDDAARALAEWT